MPEMTSANIRAVIIFIGENFFIRYFMSFLVAIFFLWYVQNRFSFLKISCIIYVLGEKNA